MTNTEISILVILGALLVLWLLSGKGRVSGGDVFIFIDSDHHDHHDHDCSCDD